MHAVSHSLRFTAEASSNALVERDFTVGEVTGVLWSPASGADRAPLVLTGHGGGQHRKAPTWRSAPCRNGGDPGRPPGTARDRPRRAGRLLRPEHGHRDRRPLAAAEPRISAAVFGLFWPDSLAGAASQITIPIEFHLQWDDEHIDRQSGLAFFGAFASEEKTLHANAGAHQELPRFEADSAARFFARHLRKSW
jgi:hypothetical protein